MMNKNNAFNKRFSYAINGLRTAFADEHSLRTQFVFAIGALLALIVLQPEPVWWALVVITSAAVISAEMINTALENICDLVQPDQHPQVEKIKDIAAGAVLILSFAALAVAALMIFSVFVS